MVAVPILAGEDITSTYLTTKLDWTANTKQQGVDLVRNANTTFLDSTDLVVPVISGARYALDSALLYDATSVADIAIRFSYPNGSTGFIANEGSPVGITTTTNAINQQASALSGSSITFTYGGVATGTVLAVTPIGGLTASADGFLTIGFAQATSEASNTLLKKWSWVCLRRTA